MQKRERELPVRLDARRKTLEPWMTALIVAIVLVIIALVIGLLIYFLIFHARLEYYRGIFEIYSVQVNGKNEMTSSYQNSDLRGMSETLVDEIFLESPLSKQYVRNRVIRLTRERGGVKADVVLVFRFTNTEPRAVRVMKIQNILFQKMKRDTRSLNINPSSVHVNALTSSSGSLTVQASCGKRLVPLTLGRIINPEFAVKNNWPWQATLQRDRVHQCGATLISNTWLVTAAHCFNTVSDPRRWTVSFGMTIQPALMRRNVRRIIVHESYRWPRHEYDIAVVQISPGVTFTEEVRRICLPEASENFPPNSTVYITGFGALYYGGESQNDLREAKVKIISDEVCRQPYVYGNEITFGMFCAGFLEGTFDACRGDSGGPLVVKDSKDTWYLIGIISWGDNCGQVNKPGVYTQVTYYRNWINLKTGL
uniref:Transmembrane protease serine n=1 Tax=Ornithorhynchus anatinus TaxID=9258 RepID=F6R3C5_ORNAN